MARKCGKCGKLNGHNAATCPEGDDVKGMPNATTTGGKGESFAPKGQPPITMPKKEMSAKEKELVSLIGLDAVLKIIELKLIDKVSIEKVAKSNIKIVNGRYQEPFTIEYADKTEQISKIIINSNMTVEPSSSVYSPSSMGDALSSYLDDRLQLMTSSDTKHDRVKYLREIMKHMDSLSKVFGFDDQRQLEAFFAAWLMKDSTCRLTGIPGTGKTTVIESAATLLANSYGFNNMTRVLLNTTQYKNYKAGQKHTPIIFPKGMNYALDYGDNENLRSLWEEWRFSDWEKPQKGKVKISGSYLYNFTFLQRMRGSTQKHPLRPNVFADTLFASMDRHIIEEKVGKSVVTSTTYSIVAKPIDAITLKGLFPNDKLPSSIKATSVGKETVYQYNGKDLYRDAGGNEGFYLRRMLMDYFYDARLDNENGGLDMISKEMLEEIGIAKIDYDKRAEEILYGIEIRQETSTNPITGNTVSEYKFDPAPRPIVTQPIKFFNEANRSGSGVEDAVLGLIAEKTVEYRGQTFKSPSFVAWMDTNPHQKGNDLAFVDRIDMELYFGTLSLGSRFNALQERYSQRKGSDPKLQLVKRITQSAKEGGVKPLRFSELRSVWNLTNGIFFNSSGKPDSEGGSLLDISLLSVLFTQRYMPKPDKVKIKYNNNETEHTYSDSSHTYFTPLVDISTTTNLQYEKQHQGEIDKYLAKEGAQAPALIERMLGFRFTNSLIKMTRALAFLRGKDYVTRQEVIDALPYCVGHRLGPAREGEDPKGRDIGINRDAMTLTNEQEWIKELILEGYVMKKTNSLMGSASEITLFDDWDSFMRKCKNTIDSNDELWIYEKEIINSMKEAIEKGSGITPVHYHIATMIVDNVKNKKAYQDSYKTYFERISRPQAIAGDDDISSQDKARQISASKSLYQYFNLRGEIVSEPYLFSDDKMRLLDLINSKIESVAGICGRKMAIGSSYPNAISNNGLMNAEYTSHGFSEVGTYGFRMYNDGLGAWGYLVSNGNNKTPIIKLGEPLLGKEGYIYEANQELSLVGGFKLVELGANFSMPTNFAKKLDSVTEALNSSVKSGIIYKYDSANKAIIINDSANMNTLNTSITTALKATYSSNGVPSFDLETGLFACFEIEHREDANYIGNSLITKGEDTLLLWVRLHNRTPTPKAVGLMGYSALEIGITSKIAKPVLTSKKKVTSPDGSDYEVFTEYELLDLKNTNLLTPSTYGGGSGWIDSGNMTEKDYSYYTKMILTAMMRE
jgi:MoxR-like ATPase